MSVDANCVDFETELKADHEEIKHSRKNETVNRSISETYPRNTDFRVSGYKKGRLV